MKNWLERFKDFILPGSAKNKETEGEPEAAPAAARTGKNSVRSGSYFAGAGKVRHPLGMTERQVNIWSLATLAIVLLDLIAFGFIAGRLLFGFTERICYAFGLDSVSFVNHSFKQVELMIAYAVDFILGGLLVWLTLGIAAVLADEAFLKIRRRHILLIVTGFAVLFLILTLISVAAGHRYDSYYTYRFMAPMLCYAGGAAFLGLASLRLDVK
ncbi:MAG: hypothetical protein J6X19_06925 [Clostridia bacterium]|nr:hypothetical protein [Clostridia bacterium]